MTTNLPRPPAWRAHPYVAIGAVLVVLAVYVHVGHHLPIPGSFGDIDKRSAQTVFNQWLLLGSVVTSFHLVFGVAGRFAFSTAAFMGLGAYVSHAVTRTSGLHWTVGMLAAIASSWLVGAGFMWAVRRAQHFYFAVATLGLAEVLLLVFGRWERLSGRSSGEISGVRELTVFGWEADSRYEHFWLLLLLLGLVLVVAAAIARSPLGREAIAARDAPAVLETTGVDPTRSGMVIFTLGCVVAGVAGSLFVHTRGLGTPETFGIELGIGIFVALILGGLHSLWGGLIGAWFYVYVPLYLERWEAWTNVIWGVVLVVVMVAFPDGLAGLSERVRRRVRRDGTALDGPAPDDVPDPGDGPPVPAADAVVSPGPLVATDITVSFGGVVACGNVSIRLDPGEVVGLTGPNGSGKSTLLNAVCGLVPASGDLMVGDASVALGEPRAARRAGIVRAFQTPHVWDALTCLENVVLGIADERPTTLRDALLTRRAMRETEEARWALAAAALGRVGLGALADRSAQALTYGQRRMLEVARTIVSRPPFLLLDEPSAGLNQAETAFLARVLADVRESGTALLVVDHKIDFLDALADRLVVLQLGRVIAEGPPAEVWRDEAVIDAYLGRAQEADG